MRFGKTLQEQVQARREYIARKAEWRKWFAWYPVRLIDRSWVWLEWVEVRYLHLYWDKFDREVLTNRRP